MIVSHAMIIALTATSYITKNFLKAEFLPTSTDVRSVNRLPV